jgi:hypothetical protein
MVFVWNTMVVLTAVVRREFHPTNMPFARDHNFFIILRHE